MTGMDGRGGRVEHHIIYLMPEVKHNNSATIVYYGLFKAKSGPGGLNRNFVVMSTEGRNEVANLSAAMKFHRFKLAKGNLP